MSQDAQTIRCRGCGQVGILVSEPQDEPGGRRRRYGFYRHGRRDGAQIVACCKCQQIQPCESDVTHHNSGPGNVTTAPRGR